MEYKQQVFNTWAPADSRWTSFAKPVLFYSITDPCKGTLFHAPITYVAAGAADTAIILDTPGASAVSEAVGLANLGFRPVPLFNGNSTIAGIELVDTASIKMALCIGAGQLPGITIANNAPPVFILDSNRLVDAFAAPGMFDNRWNVYAHDLPSPEYFMSAGIRRIIVRNNEGHILADLAPVLYNLQQSGIEIYVLQTFMHQNKAMSLDSAMGIPVENHDIGAYGVEVRGGMTRIQIRQPGFFARLFGSRTYHTRRWNSTGGWGSSKPCHGYGGRYGGGYRGGGYGGGSC